MPRGPQEPWQVGLRALDLVLEHVSSSGPSEKFLCDLSCTRQTLLPKASHPVLFPPGPTQDLVCDALTCCSVETWPGTAGVKC